MAMGSVLATSGVVVVVVGTLRQRREAVAVRRGRLAPLGPDGDLDGPVVGPAPRLHTAIAGWRPPTPRTRVGRWVARAWTGPSTVAGTLTALLGGRLPRPEPRHGCLVAAPVRGVTAAALRAMGATAATIGTVVVSRRDPVGERLLRHEALHVRQQERLGPLFAPAYALAQAVWGYRRNPFEVAARRAAEGQGPGHG
jgi:hypothetical protein